METTELGSAAGMPLVDVTSKHGAACSHSLTCVALMGRPRALPTVAIAPHPCHAEVSTHLSSGAIQKKKKHLHLRILPLASLVPVRKKAWAPDDHAIQRDAPQLKHRCFPCPVVLRRAFSLALNWNSAWRVGTCPEGPEAEQGCSRQWNGIRYFRRDS